MLRGRRHRMTLKYFLLQYRKSATEFSQQFGATGNTNTDMVNEITIVIVSARCEQISIRREAQNMARRHIAVPSKILLFACTYIREPDFVHQRSRKVAAIGAETQSIHTTLATGSQSAQPRKDIAVTHAPAEAEFVPETDTEIMLGKRVKVHKRMRAFQV